MKLLRTIPPLLMVALLVNACGSDSLIEPAGTSSRDGLGWLGGGGKSDGGSTAQSDSSAVLASGSRPPNE